MALYVHYPSPKVYRQLHKALIHLNYNDLIACGAQDDAVVHL